MCHHASPPPPPPGPPLPLKSHRWSSCSVHLKPTLPSPSLPLQVIPSSVAFRGLAVRMALATGESLPIPCLAVICANAVTLLCSCSSCTQQLLHVCVDSYRDCARSLPQKNNLCVILPLSCFVSSMQMLFVILLLLFPHRPGGPHHHPPPHTAHCVPRAPGAAGGGHSGGGPRGSDHH